jgi:S-disulfanyl-L-cysteine oxidoreductase SoxD
MAACTMSKFRRSLLVLGCTMISSVAAAPWSTLGRPATPDMVAGWDIDVRPDGTGLPPGSGSVAQGQEIYDLQCASCHGTFGESNEYMALAGGVGSLATSTPQRTIGSRLNYATTLWDYINRAMPFQQPKSLNADQVYALTAYVLNLNDIVPADAVLDQQSLPLVEMPNRHGFTESHGLSRVDGKADVQSAACMQGCADEVNISSSLPAGFVEQMYGDIREHFRGLATLREPPLMSNEHEPSSSKVASTLVATHGCLACHDFEQARVGPAFTAIAQRYADDDSAVATLAAKLKLGGAGAWGTVMMPPQTQVPAAEIDAIVRWILAGMPRE